MKSLKEYLEHPSVNESFLGKGYAVIQNRQHGANRNKLSSINSKIQSLTQRGKSEDDSQKQAVIVFEILSEVAKALAVLAEMGRNEVNVSTAGVLDSQNLRKELRNWSKQRR